MMNERASRCGTKRRYPSAEAAIAGCLEILERQRHTQKMATYHCNACNEWHKTSQIYADESPRYRLVPSPFYDPKVSEHALSGRVRAPQFKRPAKRY